MLVDELRTVFLQVFRVGVVYFIIIGIANAARERYAQHAPPVVQFAAKLQAGAHVVACPVGKDIRGARVQRVVVHAGVRKLRLGRMASAVSEVGREEDLRQCVRFPIEAEIDAHVVAPVVGNRPVVGIGDAIAGKERLLAAGPFCVVVGVRIACIATERHFLVEFFTEIHAAVARRSDARTRAAAPESAPHTREHRRAP